MLVKVWEGTTFDGRTIRRLRTLRRRARSADGREPFDDDLWQRASTQKTDVALALTVPPQAGRGRAGDGDLVATAFAARQGERRAAELLVDPGSRGRGIGGSLLSRLLAQTDGELWIWSHGDHPAARRLADRHGLDRARELLQLRRPVALPVPEKPPPPGVTVRTFVPGQDEQAWLAVNAAAFAWHPEQGSRTLDDLRQAEAEPWFDPAGFFLAESDGTVIGFHWTKVHPPPAGSPDAAPVGEVYVVGVAPQAHGTGVGSYLTAVGLEHLARQPGVSEVMLYVEGDNAAALNVYHRLGFERHSADVAYRRNA